jgi:hypothetical protein
LENLNSLELFTVLQKHAPIDAPLLPAAYRCTSNDELGIHLVEDRVRVFLDAIMLHFHVRLKISHRGPKYYEVCLFYVPHPAGTAHCKDPLTVYAEEVEG